MGDAKPFYLFFLVIRKTYSLYKKFENVEKAQKQNTPLHLAVWITDPETCTCSGIFTPVLSQMCENVASSGTESRPRGQTAATTASQLWVMRDFRRPQFLCV